MSKYFKFNAQQISSATVSGELSRKLNSHQTRWTNLIRNAEFSAFTTTRRDIFQAFILKRMDSCIDTTDSIIITLWSLSHLTVITDCTKTVSPAIHKNIRLLLVSVIFSKFLPHATHRQTKKLNFLHYHDDKKLSHTFLLSVPSLVSIKESLFMFSSPHQKGFLHAN